MYQNEVREMTENELLEFMENNGWKSTEDFIDAELVIGIYELENGTMFESAEDDILDTICKGNWSYAVEQMDDLNVWPDGLIDYIEDYRYEVYDEAYDWFKLEHAVVITEMFYKTRKVA